MHTMTRPMGCAGAGPHPQEVGKKKRKKKRKKHNLKGFVVSRDYIQLTHTN